MKVFTVAGPAQSCDAPFSWGSPWVQNNSSQQHSGLKAGLWALIQVAPALLLFGETGDSRVRLGTEGEEGFRYPEALESEQIRPAESSPTVLVMAGCPASGVRVGRTSSGCHQGSKECAEVWGPPSQTWTCLS